jgi:hypothetical protein
VTRRAAPLLAALTVVATVVVLLALTGRPVGAEVPETAVPSLEVRPVEAAPGETVRINGWDWPSLELVTVELCGAEARRGSADCVQQASRSIPTNRSGELIGALEIAIPPVPCPCVVRAWVPGRTEAHVAPVRVRGAGFAAVEVPDETGGPRVAVRARLEGSDDGAAWFGAGPERTLVLELENLSEDWIREPRLDAVWGRTGADADGMLDIPELPPLRPAGTATVEVPVELPPLSVGEFVVTGSLVGEPGSEFTVRSTSVPWGLVAIPVVVLLQWALLKGRERLRRRLHRNHAPASTEIVLDLRDPPAAPVVGLELPGVDGSDGAPDVGAPAGAPAETSAPVEPNPAAEESAEADGEASRRDRLVAAGGRGKTVAGLGVALLAGMSLWLIRGAPAEEPTEPLAEDAFCERLEELDVVRSLAGEDATAKARAIVGLSELARRAPDEVRVALAILDREVAERPGLEVAAEPSSDPGPDAWATLWRALYRLEYDEDFLAAATQVEKYAVERCDMEPSGVFDIDVPFQDLAPAPELDFADVPLQPELDLSARDAQRELLVQLPPPEITFDLEGMREREQLQIFEPPPVEFDRTGWEERYGPG